MQTALVSRASGLAALKSVNRAQKPASSRNLAVRAAEQEPQSSRPAKNKDNFAQANVFNSGTTEKLDSYQLIEEPVRSNDLADKGFYKNRPVAERQNDLDRQLVDVEGEEEKRFLGTAVAFPDALRFKGAAPEVINSRLAMLGMVLALVAEFRTNKNVSEQVAEQPFTVAGIFTLWIVASLVPILRGAPRRSNGIFNANAEIIVGRIAMIGFAALVLTEFASGGKTIPQVYGLF
jgi:hypothetical protein